MLKFIEKVEKRNKLKVGFIGGSITLGAVAGSNEYRFSDQLCNMLEKSFNKSDFKQINAGVAAAGCRFAASRVKSDLLNESPDLIILDLSVNLNTLDTLNEMQAFEGLIRQCLQNEDVPVIILHFTTENESTINQQIISRIANHYSLPIISYQNAVMSLINDGKLNWKSIAYDDIHPNYIGHFLAAYMLNNFIYTIYQNRNHINPPKIKIPNPYSTDLYQYSDIFPNDQEKVLRLTYNRNWILTKDKNLKYHFETVLKGDSIVFTSTARELTIMFNQYQNYSGEIGVWLDGKLINQLKANSPVNFQIMKNYQVFSDEIKKTRTICLTNLKNERFSIPYILYAK